MKSNLLSNKIQFGNFPYSKLLGELMMLSIIYRTLLSQFNEAERNLLHPANYLKIGLLGIDSALHRAHQWGINFLLVPVCPIEREQL